MNSTGVVAAGGDHVIAIPLATVNMAVFRVGQFHMHVEICSDREARDPGFSVRR